MFLRWRSVGNKISVKYNESLFVSTPLGTPVVSHMICVVTRVVLKLKFCVVRSLDGAILMIVIFKKNLAPITGQPIGCPKNNFIENISFKI